MTDEALITRLAMKHSVSADAVRTVLRALRSGGGRMAQLATPTSEVCRNARPE
jgi:hypothetical protein